MWNSGCNSCGRTCGSSCGSANSASCRRERLQAIADAIPMQRYVPEQTSPSCCCPSCSGESGREVRYFGYAAQEAASGASLLLARYSPADEAAAATSVYLPCGRYLIAYSVNASAVQPPAASTTATLGIAPQINGVAFPRGGSFATVPADGSGVLSSAFVVTLPNAVNTLGFYNTGSLNTAYQLLNVTVTRLG